MRLDHQIDTPWAVYAMAYSNDGTRLAIGGGTYYGLGGIVMVDLATREQTLSPLADLLPSPHQGGTIAGLAFSADDRQLLAATWNARHHSGPTLAMAVDGLTLELCATRRFTVGFGTVGGIVIDGERSISRAAGQLENAFEIQAWRELVLDRSPPRQHLTGNRLAITRGHAVTGDQNIYVGNERLAPGLVVRPLDGVTCTHVPAVGSSRVTAIATTANDALITGSLHGEVDQWSWVGPLLERGTRIGVVPQQIVPSVGRWITYQPASVVGICSLSDGRLVAVTAGGDMATWRDGEPLRVRPLPVPGSPRSIAAHPDRAVVAIGLKRDGFGEPESAVAVIEIEPQVVLDAWRTPRVLAMAGAADTQRQRPLDRIALGVLADALEETGCDGRFLQHLRSHDPRVHTCWVIDRLLGR